MEQSETPQDVVLSSAPESEQQEVVKNEDQAQQEEEQQQIETESNEQQKEKERSVGNLKVNNNVDEFGLPLSLDNTSTDASTPEKNNSTPTEQSNQEEEDDDEDDDDDDITVEDEEEEKTSIDMSALKAKLPTFDSLFEYFIVVGIPTAKNPRIGTLHKSELLFSYPPNKPVPHKAHEFCFPNGISPFLIKRTPSCSNLNEVLYGQPYLHSSEYFYTFVLTGETPLYGICITKPELLSTIPNFFPEQPTPLDKKSTYITAPRSYCFLSKLPLFNLHFDSLLYLLAQDRLITITRELSSAEESEEREEEEMRNNSTPSTPPLPVTPAEVVVEEKKIQETGTDSTTTTINNTETPETAIATPIESTIPVVETTTTSTDSNTTESTDSPVTTTAITTTAPQHKEPILDEKDYKHLVDKKNLLDILKYYSEMNTSMIKPGENLEFTFPGEISKRCYPIPAGKNTDEVNSKSIAHWSTIGIFMHLGLENILKVLGAVLLEQRVALIDYLEAPVPFIAGVQVLRKKSFDGLIVDIANDKIYYNQCSAPPLLPEFRKLQRNLSADQQILLNEKNHNPIKNTPTQIEAIHRIFNTIQQYVWWLVKKIENSFMVNDEVAADSLKIEELKTKFLSTVSGHNKDFVSILLDTQHFSSFLHSTLLAQGKAKEQLEKDTLLQQQQQQQQQPTPQSK
eukprot:gene7448-8714_t